MACSWPFKQLECFGHSGPEGSWFEPGHVKISFFKGHGRHVHFFLLLPNDTGAPCLGGIHIVHSLKLTNVQCTETWVSPRPRVYESTEKLVAPILAVVNNYGATIASDEFMCDKVH